MFKYLIAYSCLFVSIFAVGGDVIDSQGKRSYLRMGHFNEPRKIEGQPEQYYAMDYKFLYGYELTASQILTISVDLNGDGLKDRLLSPYLNPDAYSHAREFFAYLNMNDSFIWLPHKLSIDISFLFVSNLPGIEKYGLLTVEHGKNIDIPKVYTFEKNQSAEGRVIDRWGIYEYVAPYSPYKYNHLPEDKSGDYFPFSQDLGKTREYTINIINVPDRGK